MRVDSGDKYKKNKDRAGGAVEVGRPLQVHNTVVTKRKEVPGESFMIPYVFINC